MNPQILLYELTRAVGRENLEAATKELEQVATLAEGLYKVIDQLDQAAKDDSGKDDFGRFRKPSDADHDEEQ